MPIAYETLMPMPGRRPVLVSVPVPVSVMMMMLLVLVAFRLEKNKIIYTLRPLKTT